LTSCSGFRVLAAQELPAPLLVRALFLGCTVPDHIYSFPEKCGIEQCGNLGFLTISSLD